MSLRVCPRADQHLGWLVQDAVAYQVHCLGLLAAAAVAEQPGCSAVALPGVTAPTSWRRGDAVAVAMAVRGVVVMLPPLSCGAPPPGVGGEDDGTSVEASSEEEDAAASVVACS